MKALLLYGISLIATSISAFSQCPQPGLNIQSTACVSPISLRVDGVSCSVLKVKWQGIQNQAYIVKATGIDPVTGKAYDADAPYSCDGFGNCQATIGVRQGIKVQWSVQASCTEGAAVLNSAKQEGPGVDIPGCPQGSFPTLKVYPNPTDNKLLLEFTTSLTGTETFAVYDMAGKELCRVPAKSVTQSGNGYKVNLPHLSAGTYLLQVRNAKGQSMAKFEVMKR